DMRRRALGRRGPRPGRIRDGRAGLQSRGLDPVHVSLLHRSHAMSLAIAKAAAAASPPTITVCQALRHGFFTVKRPLMYPKRRSARTVMTIEPFSAEAIEWNTK